MIFEASNPEGLSGEELVALVHQAMASHPPMRRVLVIVPDETRVDNTHLLFPALCEELLRLEVEQIDVLVAQGTHPPMSAEAKRAKLGLSGEIDPRLRLLDHRWDDAAELKSLGQLSAEQVSELSEGLWSEPIDVLLNRRLAPGAYDRIFVLGATLPHEVAGFSGGSKYFLPGVAGPDLIHVTHWIAALCGIPKIIGRVDNPVRRMIEAAAEHIAIPKTSLNSVVDRRGEGVVTLGLFIGIDDMMSPFRAAAELAGRHLVRRVPRLYRRVIAIVDHHYSDLWTGAKPSYKLGGIIEPGGELILYAPHIETLSVTHGELIERYGYRPLPEIKAIVEEERRQGARGGLADHLAVAAHLTHLVYDYRTVAGAVQPKYRITLASQVPESTCTKVGLGYLSPDSFDPDYYRGREEEGILVVDRAGQYLYRLEDETEPEEA